MKPSERFDSLIRYWAERAALPFDRVRSQVEAESSFNPRAVSTAGAMGLMQLMPGTARDLGCLEPFNPDENLKAGTTYMARIIAEIQIRGGLAYAEPDIYRMALAGYTGGPGYIYAALRIVTEDGFHQTWTSVKDTLPRAKVRGKTIRVKDAVSYSEKILPPPQV